MLFNTITCYTLSEESSPFLLVWVLLRQYRHEIHGEAMTACWLAKEMGAPPPLDLQGLYDAEQKGTADVQSKQESTEP